MSEKHTLTNKTNLTELSVIILIIKFAIYTVLGKRKMCFYAQCALIIIYYIIKTDEKYMCALFWFSSLSFMCLVPGWLISFSFCPFSCSQMLNEKLIIIKKRN